MDPSQVMHQQAQARDLLELPDHSTLPMDPREKLQTLFRAAQVSIYLIFIRTHIFQVCRFMCDVPKISTPIRGPSVASVGPPLVVGLEPLFCAIVHVILVGGFVGGNTLDCGRFCTCLQHRSH